MCGIVFVAGNILANHKRAFTQLLTIDQLRGEDSTGILAVHCNTKAVHIAKDLGTPDRLLESKIGKRIIDLNSCLLIGHNRYATVGGVSRDTAHPFEFDNVAGVHNGTINAKWRLKDAKDFVVDSENLYHHISDEGIDDAISQLGHGVNAWSLAYFDKAKKEFNLLRNKERPMFYCRSKDGRTMFGASEYWMLEGVLLRNGIEYQEIYSTDEDVLYTMGFAANGDLDKPHIREVKAPEYETHYNNFTKGSVSGKKTGNNVLALPFVQLDSKYAGKKGVVVEILSHLKDTAGGKFLQLFDETRPDNEIRLYYRKEDALLADMEGCFLSVNIATLHQATDKSWFFKANPNDVKVVGTWDGVEEVFPDNKGVPLSKKGWEEQYTQCDYCSTNLVAGSGVKFTTQGECFCKECAEDKEISQFVNFV